MFRSSKFFVVLLVLIFASAAFAFAATNTVDATRAGEGAEVISGYTVTLVDYNLNATNPSNIDSVEFRLSGAANLVKISLVTGGQYYNCTNTAGNDWSCDTTIGVQATVAASNSLRVIATD
jgi:hypothetical protein